MKRGQGLSHDPARAAERRQRREARREAEGPRPEDLAREERRAAREQLRAGRESADAAFDRRMWRAKVIAGGCVMCKAFPLDAATRRERAADIAVIDPHHVVSQDELKRWGLDERLFDPRNGIALCRLHHGRHELAYQRVPRELLPPAAFEFADEIGARFVLEDDRVYPERGT